MEKTPITACLLPRSLVHVPTITIHLPLSNGRTLFGVWRVHAWMHVCASIVCVRVCQNRIRGFQFSQYIFQKKKVIFFSCVVSSYDTRLADWASSNCECVYTVKFCFAISKSTNWIWISKKICHWYLVCWCEWSERKKDCNKYQKVYIVCSLKSGAKGEKKNEERKRVQTEPEKRRFEFFFLLLNSCSLVCCHTESVCVWACVFVCLSERKSECIRFTFFTTSFSYLYKFVV